MAYPISSITISASIYHLLVQTKDELKYTSLNDVIKFVLTLSANNSIIDKQYLKEAKIQLKIFKKIEQLAEINEPNTVVHLRLQPTLKKHASDEYILAGLLFLNIIEINPTNIYHLTESEIQLILSAR